MTDIVERLRYLARDREAYESTAMSEAADEIERLREENKRFREALQCYDCDCKDDECKSPFYDCGRIARDALKEGE